MSKDRVKVPQVMQMEAVECGAASLAMILAYYERWVPLDKLREDCGVGRDGTSADAVLEAAREYDLEAKDFSYSIDELIEKKPFPCILQWNIIQKYIGTRSCKQIISHAQKFFLRLKRLNTDNYNFNFRKNNIVSSLLISP